MKRIEIKKNGTLTNLCEAADEEAATWLAQHLAMGTFGEGFEVVEADITAELEEKRIAKEAWKLKRDTAKARIKDKDISKITTVKDLKEVVQDLVDLLKEEE